MRTRIGAVRRRAGALIAGPVETNRIGVTFVCHGLLRQIATDIAFGSEIATDQLNVCFTPKSGHQALLDFRSCSHQISFRRAALQSPGLFMPFRPSTALKPAHRAEDFGKCLISPEFSSDSGNRFRAFDSRPVSCHMQPSVVSLLRRRDMLCTNDVYSPTLEAESSVQPSCKSRAKG